MVNQNYPVFSIIMPTFNCEESISSAVSSVLTQSYESFELIIVDDGSVDNTAKVVSKFSDPRIRYIGREHGGVSLARNIGIKESNGRYIAFLDADNIWMKNFLEEFYCCFRSHSSDYIAGYSNGILYDKGRLKGEIPPLFSAAILFHQPLIDLNGFVVKASVAKAFGMFDEDLFRWVDYEMMLRVSEEGKWFHIEKILYQYNRNVNGITHSSDKERPWLPTKTKIKQLRHDSLRIGYVLWDFPAASQMFVMNELTWLSHHNYDVEVYYFENAVPAADFNLNIPCYKVSSSDHLAVLAKLSKRNILHSHFGYPHTTLLCWPAAEKALIPFTCMPHGIDIFSNSNRARVCLDKISLSSFCKKIFAIGSFHRNHYVQSAVSAHKIENIPCSVESEWLNPNADFFRPIRNISLVSRLVEKKGVFDFIEIAKRCYDLPITFHLFGYGPLENKLSDAVKGCNNIVLNIGKIRHDDVKTILDNSDAILLPCHRAADGDMDGLPVILLEGAARGCLLFSSNVSSISDLISNSITGFISEPKDIDSFAKNIRKACSLPNNILQEIRAAAYAYVRENHDIDCIMKKILDVWTSDFLQYYP